MSSELEQPLEQNVEEIQECQTTTMSEKTEEEIPKKDEDLSIGSIEDANENTVKEDKSFLDGKTREIESTLENELIGEKTTTNPEEITKQAFQESQTETSKEIEGKLDAKSQDDGREDRSEMKDEVIVTEKISSELEQPLEQNVEELQACQTTAMSEKTEEEILEKDEDLSLGSIEDANENTVKEDKSFLDERTREIEISALVNEPIGEKTTINPEITKQVFQESQTETNKEIEGKLEAKSQADGREDRSEMKDEVIETEKMSSKLEQPLQQNVEEIQACQTTTMIEKTDEEIPEKDEDLSLGSMEDANDNTVKEEKNFVEGRTREIEISALEDESVGEKTTIKPEEITKKAFQESQTETNKEIEGKLDAENQANVREDRSEMKDEVIVTEKISPELGQPMEQNVGEIQECQTTAMSEKTEEKIPEKDDDLSIGGIEDTNDNIVKEEKNFVDGRTREIEISALEDEPVGEKTTIKSEEITKQAFQESQTETIKEIDGKLDAQNLAGRREDRNEMKDEVFVTEKISSELGQPMEQNVEDNHACQTTTMSEAEQEIAENNEDLSLDSIDDTYDTNTKEEKNFLDERTKKIEISRLEPEPIGEQTTIQPEEITKQAFQESQTETNKEIEGKLDAESQADERDDRSEIKDEVIVTEKMSSELEQPLEQNVEDIQACQATAMSEKTEEEILEKDEDLSLGSIKDENENTVKEDKSFLDGKTREIESTLDNEPIGEKTTINPEEITKKAFQESQTEISKEIEGKLDAKSLNDEREDRSEMKDEVIVTEKISSELEQPLEQNVEEIQACQTTAISEKTEEEIAKKDEDLSLGSIEDTNDNIVKEDKSFLDGRTREIEISALQHEPGEDKTTMKQEEITKEAFQQSQTERNKEIEGKVDVENQDAGREDISEKKYEVVTTEKMSSELGQPMEQNVDEEACQTKTISEEIKDDIVENDEDLSHGSIEDRNDNTTREEKSFLDGRTREIEISTLEQDHVEEKNGDPDELSKKKNIDLNEATSVELQEDFTPSGSPGTLTEDTLNSENSKAENENLSIGAPDSVSEVQIPREVPKSEDSSLKEQCLISAIAKPTNEERTVKKEISNDEIAYSDPIPVENNPEVTEVRVDAQIGQENLQAAEDVNCESKTSPSIQDLKTDTKEGAGNSTRISGEVENDGVDETPKQKRIRTLEDAATLEPQVNLSNIESTYPSESDKSPTQALESVIDVQTPEVVADSEESKVEEERIVLPTAEHKDENNGEEEQEVQTTKISSAEIAGSKQVVKNPSIMDENLEPSGELNPTSELMTDEDQVNETKPQPEQSDITSANITNYQTLESKLEQTSEKDSNRSWDIEEDATLTPENQINSTEDQNETMKNVIFKEKVVAETEKKEGKTEVQEEDSEEDNCPIELEKISTSNQKEVANEIEYSESIPTENTEVAEVKAESQRELKNIPEEAPNHEFENDKKNDELISEIQTPEAILEMEMKEEHLEATNDSCETLIGGLSNEKLLDELKEIDAKEDIDIIVRKEEKVAEDSYQDAVAEATTHEHLSQTEEKLVSMVPHEELTSEDQTNEVVTETDNTKVEHSSISNRDQNPEELTKSLTEDQSSVKEKHNEEEWQGDFGVENKEAKSGNEAVEDVLVNEVLLGVEKAKESKSIEDNINEEANCVPNQLTSATDEVFQIKRLNSSPNELLEEKDSVEDIGDPKLMAENLNLKAETFTVMKGPNEEIKKNVEKTSEIVASEFESSENMVMEEKMIEADANKEKEILDEPQADDPAKTTSDSISSSTEQAKEVRSEESSGHGDMHKLEEEPTEVDETDAEGKEVSAMLTENLQEASPKMLLVKHDPETTTTIEKIKEDSEVKDEKTGELQVSTLNTEIDEGKQDGTGDLLNKESEAVQPHEHISDIKFVDPPSDVDIREQGDLMHCGSQEPSEVNSLPSQNDKKIVDLLVLPSRDDQKHENDLDYTSKARIVDVVSMAESPEIEQQHLDTKEATVEPINKETQSEQKKEAEIPIEKVPDLTTAHKEIADEFLVMPVAKEEEKSNYLQHSSKEEARSEKRTYQDLETVTEPSQTDKLSDKVKKVEPIDIQEETMAEGNLHEEETEKRTNITETTINLHHREKGDETNRKATSTEAAIPIEYVKSSNVDLKGDMDEPVPKCASTRNPEVRSAILEGLSGMDATAAKADYNKDPYDKTAESHMVEKRVLKESIHHESTCKGSETTEKTFGTNQEPNLPLTKERSMELDEPVMPGTAATETMEISQKYVTDDLIKTSQIQPELQKNKVSACDVGKQLPDKPYQNESMESKLLTGNIDASHEQEKPAAKSLNANAKDLKPTIASSTEPQCSSEVVKEEKKISDEKEKSEFTDMLHESRQRNSEVAENLIEKREPAPKNDQQVDQEESGDNGAKTDEEDEAEEDFEDNQKMGSGSDALVMVEASKDMEVKVHKKSHNILSGVGSKVKHSIAKVKKAITGKSSHPKPPSPKERD